MTFRAGRPLVTVLVILCLPQLCLSQAPDLNVALMDSTFKIVGFVKPTPDLKPGERNVGYGTVFILGRPIPSQPGRAAYVLITAAHVLDDFVDDTAVIVLRHKKGDRLERLPLEIKIRNKGVPLYVRHKDSSIDVAAMYVNIPETCHIPLISTTLLADDSVFAKYEIHPGDELFALGYPLSVDANEAGYPILRSGKIASHPLIPATSVKTFLFDFHVFDGNSGGPVYFSYSNRTYGGMMRVGDKAQYVVGLVSAQLLSKIGNQRIEAAVVVHAHYIIETMNLLPSPETRSTAK